MTEFKTFGGSSEASRLAERGVKAHVVGIVLSGGFGTRLQSVRADVPKPMIPCHGLPLRYLDLGCAGGGQVLDFLLRGHVSIGVEGSNRSLLAQRTDWRVLPNNLFTAE